MQAATRSGVAAASGFRAAAGSAGIKAKSQVDDVAVVISDLPAVAAGVFTTNRVKAAPVLWSQKVVRQEKAVRAVLINSGNANACTGLPGVQVVRRSAHTVATALACGAREVLIASTGVIGVPLDDTQLQALIPALVQAAQASRTAEAAAARAIMTTDTRPKEYARAVEVDGSVYHMGGMAKGAGMIHPLMATMLAVVTTDAPLAPAQAQAMLKRAVARSFNAITIDGDTSTNDTAFFLANGAAGGAVLAGSRAEAVLQEALDETCAHLAEAIVQDAEGASKVIEVRVRGARSERAAQMLARTIASSLLVKTAIHGGDPNWGRILAAAGRAGVALAPEKLALRIGGHLVADRGMAHPAGEKAAAQYLTGQRIVIELVVGAGAAEGWALGSDLSSDYVSINAHYRT